MVTDSDVHWQVLLSILHRGIGEHLGLQRREETIEISWLGLRKGRVFSEGVIRADGDMPIVIYVNPDGGYVATYEMQ